MTQTEYAQFDSCLVTIFEAGFFIVNDLPLRLVRLGEKKIEVSKKALGYSLGFFRFTLK